MLQEGVLLAPDATAHTLLTGPWPDLCRADKQVPHRGYVGMRWEYSAGSTVLHSTATCHSITRQQVLLRAEPYPDSCELHHIVLDFTCACIEVHGMLQCLLCK
jgi:hypothetical protein